MISRRAVSFGVFTALALASGLAAGPAFAFTQDVKPVPFDGKTGGPAYHQQGSGISCFVVGASCNKGPMPPWVSNGSGWERGGLDRRTIAHRPFRRRCSRSGSGCRTLR